MIQYIFHSVKYCILLLALPIACSHPTEPDAFNDAPDTFHMLSNNVRVFRHSFGVVKPHSTSKHRFRIANDTQSTWTLSELGLTCSCTAPEIDWTAIAPGETASIDVVYNSDGRNKDDRRLITVHFAEEEAPKLQLELVALVRANVVAAPSELRLSLPSGEVRNEGLFLNVYKDNDWADIKVTSSEPWVTAVTQLAYDGSFRYGDPESTSPRQKWECITTIDSRELATGPHTATLAFHTLSPNDPVFTLPVYVDIQSPLSAVPDMLFFHDLKKNITSKATVAIDLHSTMVISANDFEVAHTLGDMLEVDLQPSEDGNWYLHAKITPKRSGVTKGIVNITIPKIGGDIALPVITRTSDGKE